MTLMNPFGIKVVFELRIKIGQKCLFLVENV